MPRYFLRIFEDFNRQISILPREKDLEMFGKKRPLDESQTIFKGLFKEFFKEGIFPSYTSSAPAGTCSEEFRSKPMPRITTPLLEELNKEIEAGFPNNYRSEIGKPMIRTDLLDDIQRELAQMTLNRFEQNPFERHSHRPITIKEVRLKEMGLGIMENVYKNLPQGSPTSPILTILGLNSFVNQCKDAVFYADDGIFFSDKPIKLWNSVGAGIFIHPEKSSYIVENGEVKKECKFLGLTYNLVTKQLRGSTRKGSTLVLVEKAFQMLNFVAYHLDKKLKGNRVERLLKSGVGGYFLACLYKGTYDLTSTRKDFEYARGS